MGVDQSRHCVDKAAVLDCGDADQQPMLDIRAMELIKWNGSENGGGSEGAVGGSRKVTERVEDRG